MSDEKTDITRRDALTGLGALGVGGGGIYTFFIRPNPTVVDNIKAGPATFKVRIQNKGGSGKAVVRLIFYNGQDNMVGSTKKTVYLEGRGTRDVTVLTTIPPNADSYKPKVRGKDILGSWLGI